MKKLSQLLANNTLPINIKEMSDKQIREYASICLIEEQNNNPYLSLVLNEELLLEMGMKRGKFSDKFGEIVGELSNDLISICIYPNNTAINHWKGCAIGLCEKFISQDIDPRKSNTEEIRKECLTNGLYETLNEDFSALLKRFEGVITKYSRKTGNEKLTPILPLEEAYRKFKPIISSVLLILVDEIAKQNFEGVRTAIENFTPND